MKAVLASLKPYYYYLVGECIKKIEVRKSQPKADDWDKETYFYMSKDEKSFAMIPKKFQEKYRKHFGKVGLKFVCDRIDTYSYGDLIIPTPLYDGDDSCIDCGAGYYIWPRELNQICLTYDQLYNYGKGKTLYGWHISDLVIYDEPKTLGEFFHYCEKQPCQTNCWKCDRYDYIGNACLNAITRPPESWRYLDV